MTLDPQYLPAFIEIGSEKYEAEKERASKMDPLLKMVRLREIGLDRICDEVPCIQFMGKNLYVSGQFVNELATHLGLGRKLHKLFDKQNDESSKAALVRAIKKYVDRYGKDDQMMLVGSRAYKYIESIKKANRLERLPNLTVFHAVERLIEEFPNLKIHTMGESKDGSTFSLNLLDPTPIDYREQYGRDEMFMFGVSVQSNFTQSYLTGYNLRLSCMNGMIESPIWQNGAWKSPQMTALQGASILGTNIKLTEPEQLFEHIRAAEPGEKSSGMIPDWFEEQVGLATDVYASLSEVKAALSFVSDSIDEADKDIREQYATSIEDNYFQGIRMTRDRAARSDVFIDDLDKKDYKYLRTSMKVWDVINSITDLASNQHGIPMKDEFRQQGRALGGRFLTRQYDLVNAEHIKRLLNI